MADNFIKTRFIVHVFNKSAQQDVLQPTTSEVYSGYEELAEFDPRVAEFMATLPNVSKIKVYTDDECFQIERTV